MWRRKEGHLMSKELFEFRLYDAIGWFIPNVTDCWVETNLGTLELAVGLQSWIYKPIQVSIHLPRYIYHNS